MSTLTRKIRLGVVGETEEVNRVYRYIQDGMYNQNKAFNILASTIYAAIREHKSKDEIKDIYKRGARKPKEDNPEYSIYSYGEISFPKGMKTQSSVYQKVKSIFDTKHNKQALELLKGNISLPTLKRDAPLWIESQQFEFYHNYSSDDELNNKLFAGDVDIYMKFVNGICFRIIFGNPYKSQELRRIFKKIFDGEYKVCGSSIQFEDKGITKKEKGSDIDNKNKGRKIILNLTLKIPDNKIKDLDENKVVGVDLGVAIPAVCALNDDKYERLSIGSADEFLRQRTKIQAQKRRLQSQLKYTSGGHGRKKKLRALDSFKEREHRFCQTYNHMVSRRVVDFAIRHKAKYINLEDLSGFDSNQFILRNWSYYELQQFITYKAAQYGIEVRKINPAYTSQTCSICGNKDKSQRKSQSVFCCNNPDCESHVIYTNKKKQEVFNADFNAARNIAMSTNFIEDDETDDGDKGLTKKRNSKKIISKMYNKTIDKS